MKRTIEHLANGNVSINGVELVPPDWFRRRAKKPWAMKDADGNLIVEGAEGQLFEVLRDPTFPEACAAIERRSRELLASDRATTHRDALKMALDDLRLHARVYNRGR